jgi:hypothetical protein
MTPKMLASHFDAPGTYVERPILDSVTLGAVAVGLAAAASADPAPFSSGFGNAQDTVNALTARGYNVVLNEAAVSSLSSCKVVGVEG